MYVMSALSYIVFLVLDLVDFVLCIFYRFLDWFFEGKASHCYCQNKGDHENVEDLSETLYRRKNVFSEILGIFSRKCETDHNCHKMGGARWSDCGCESCLSWMNNNNGGDHKLYVRILEPSQETVFPNLSEPIKHNYKLFAVDLLGFGRSPKPRNCLYTLKDHLRMIEKSVICPYQLECFHIVAHSMGCVLAIALAAKYPNSVKSITLVAPPFFPSKDCGNLKVLEKLAEKRLWPPLLFGSAVMSWYEHIGRSVCFLICRNHRTLEKILKLFTRRRDLHFSIMDFTRHSHNSAWHTMHNVICGGSKLMESYVEALTEAGVKICVVQGDQDVVVPIERSRFFDRVASNVQVDFIRGADHISVILGRENEFTRYLEHVWASLI